MSLKLIDIQDVDFDVVKEVYDYYVVNSTATFHLFPISEQDLKETIWVGHPKCKSYLVEYEGEKIGYCYLAPFNKKQAYDHTAEVTIYIKTDFTGRGIGKSVLDKLEVIAKLNGIKVLVGLITGENLVSIKLFEKCGYEQCAFFKQVGKKFNKILDVVAYQKILA